MTYKQQGTRGILQAFPISVHSRRITAMTEHERINLALEQVEMIYPGMRKHFEGGVAKCWDEYQWAHGASAYYKPMAIQLIVAACCTSRRQNSFRRRTHFSVD